MAENRERLAQDSESLKNWLDNLQQESWQLELLISGFVLFLLIGGWEPITALEYDLELLRSTTDNYFAFNFIYYTLRTAYLSLLVCLLFHVVLRGIWIAAVGLRSVSGEINYDSLRYHAKFTDRLRRRTGSFDRYIERMERNCSVVFSLAFMIIFCFLSLIGWALFSILVQQGALWLSGGTYQGNGVLGGAGLVSFVVLIVGVIYFTDFISLGWIKKNRWLAKPYYYLYVFMGWVTLARFYRPIYYNLVDNHFGRRLTIALPFIIFALLVVISVNPISYSYFPALVGNGQVWLDSDNYDDETQDRHQQIWRMSLASRYPENDYLEAFVPYRPVHHDPVVEMLYPNLEVSQYVGLKLRGAFTLGKKFNQDADYPLMLKAMGELHQLYVNDSLRTELSPLFHFHPARAQPGLQYMIPVHDLPAGRHQLMVKSRVIDADSLRWSNGRTIYFYK